MNGMFIFHKLQNFSRYLSIQTIKDIHVRVFSLETALKRETVGFYPINYIRIKNYYDSDLDAVVLRVLNINP